MKIYLAPLQGLTDWIFRESFCQNIGIFDKTFSPFIRVKAGEFYRPSQCKDILPANNTFQHPVPQFMGNDVESFRRFEALCLEQNYKEVNINMGCPFPLLTGKKLGAGILAHPKNVAEFLEGAFTNSTLKISVKCRLGQESSAEFEELIPIFNAFPLEEIIIHPRIGKQQYKGEVDLDAFGKYAPQLKAPVCFNGDILTTADVEKAIEIFPTLNAVMIGRGMIRNPFLLEQIKQQQSSPEEKYAKLRGFHISMLERCKTKYVGDLHLLKRLEELWEYHADGFEDGRKIYKKVKKCKTMANYEAVIFEAIKQLTI